MPTSRDFLLGETLANGWKIVKKLVAGAAAGGTGSNFSTGYIVESDKGAKYFMKAIDFDTALAAADPARALQVLLDDFNFERDLVDVCRKYSCVVTAISDGTMVAPGTGGRVQYLLFELAETDVRKLITAPARIAAPLALHILHRAALGLRQLHSSETAPVAHQDVKPSNVLGFAGRLFKIADMGRASVKGKSARHDLFAVAGDPTYSPIEQHFGHLSPEFNERRLACDNYMLGGLAFYLFTQVSITAFIMNRLDITARPPDWGGTWGGTFYQALPQIQLAFSDAMDTFAQTIADTARYKPELVRCVRDLCEPDPARRGHPLTRAQNARAGNAYDLEKYVAIFNRLATEAEIHERRAAHGSGTP